jgi:hemolysin activation/secretion protein
MFSPMFNYSRAIAAATAAGALLVCGTTSAQQAMPEATGATTTFTINGFELTGDIPLPSADTTRILTPFIGPGKTLDVLQKATSALEAELKAKGYALHRVSLPPQEVGAKVTLNIVKFVIGTVTVEGLSAYTEANIRASLPELREGEAPNFKTLAVQTTIANENPGKQVKVTVKESEEADKIDVKLVLKESTPWSFSASLANTGTESSGRDRLSVVAGHANVLGLDHQASMAYTTSVERTNDVKQLGLNYRIPLYRLGGVVGLSYTNADVVGNFGTFTSTGAGETYGVSYSHYLPPEGGRREFLLLGLDQKTFNATKINGTTVPGQVDRGSNPVSLGYNLRVEEDVAAWGYNAELAANLGAGAGNTLSAYQAEDPRVRTVHWSALRGGASYLAPFGMGWLWSARGQFQFSGDALISGEQFGLGGVGSVRGAPDRAVVGDSGLLTSLELTTPELAPGLRLIGFAEGGWVSNNNTDLNPNKASTDRLASVGLGLRYAAGALGLTAEWGRLVLGAATPPSGAVVPRAGDDKLHVSLTARF